MDRILPMKLPYTDTDTMSALRMHIWRVLLLLGICLMLLLIFHLNPDFEFAGYSHEEHINNTPDLNNHKHSDSVRNLQSVQSYDKQSQKDDFSIHTQERNHFKFKFGGFVFKETGSSFYLTADITSCMTHSFSPYVEQEAAKRFLDPAHDNIYYANSPALVWYKGELVLVTRIWLDREKYEPKSDWPSNHFADNFLYTQKFDRELRPVSNGTIIGIPSPKQWWVGDGPIEPRIFVSKGRLFITFNAAMAFRQMFYMDFTVIWDYDMNMPIIPNIEGGTPMINATEPGDMPRDKHWMALQIADVLYFVHNLDPLRVLKCDPLSGQCKFVYKAKQSQGGVAFADQVSHLRGGTPFEVYSYPYYISVAHSTMYKSSNGHRFYTAHLVVLCVEPWRVVYVSDDLKIDPEIYENTPMVRPRWIDDGFIFPVGIILENTDWLTIGVHVNDHSSILLRFKGIKALMSAIIEQDRKQGATDGPPIGYLQNHIHQRLQNITNMHFIHSPK